MSDRCIVFACDEEYAMPLATALRSIVEASPRSVIDVYVLCERFDFVLRQRVRESLPSNSARISWIPVDLEQFAEFETLEHVSKMTYARLLIPELLPPSTARAIYLDADLLVLSDLNGLWNETLDGAVVGAVRDSIDGLLKQHDGRLVRVPRVSDYFNAGVLLVDVQRWREEKISERAIQFLSRAPYSPFADQDALNVACDGRWKHVASKWNFQAHLTEDIGKMRVSDRPAIVHFVTARKPWSPCGQRANAAFYDGFRGRTKFARTRGEAVANILKALLCHAKAFARTYLQRLVVRQTNVFR